MVVSVDLVSGGSPFPDYKFLIVSSVGGRASKLPGASSIKSLTTFKRALL